MSEWQHRKTEELFKNSSIKNQEGEELLSVTQDNGVLPRSMLERRVVMPDGNTKNYKLVERGDFIISLRSFQGGLEFSEYRGLVSPAYTVIKHKVPMEEGFYKQYFKSQRFISQLNSSVVGIRDGKQISYQVFKNMEVPYPPLAEQRKIAEILTSVDNAISKTEVIIEKTEKVKKGLMQELLTKGIGHAKFKQTAIGDVPEKWEVYYIEKLAEQNRNAIKPGPFGSSLKKEFYVKHGYRVYGQEQVIAKDFSKGDYYIDDQKFKELKSFEVRPNDLLISLVGTFGKIAIVPENAEPGIINPRLLKVTFDSSKANVKYYYYYMSSPYFYKQLEALSQGGTMGVINGKILKSLLFPCPPVSEQRQIVKIFESIDAKLIVEMEKLDKLNKLKKGLMQVLLTGKVRVKVEDHEAAVTK
ncbi:restriction endonuclease subunit S [Paenibacillus sp. GM2FR]|uniref:restriction endonuclease subunit S n=1 Tax=Paenibacillus sp. GM2FR TaxID=2059268 RepID=UPI0013FD913E|nr:restriction endonuclease subunit S [Paenibacillus sp. GM2FR]